jgi:hypothetical protein
VAYLKLFGREFNIRPNGFIDLLPEWAREENSSRVLDWRDCPPAGAARRRAKLKFLVKSLGAHSFRMLIYLDIEPEGPDCEQAWVPVRGVHVQPDGPDDADPDSFNPAFRLWDKGQEPQGQELLRSNYIVSSGAIQLNQGSFPNYEGVLVNDEREVIFRFTHLRELTKSDGSPVWITNGLNLRDSDAGVTLDLKDKNAPQLVLTGRMLRTVVRLGGADILPGRPGGAPRPFWEGDYHSERASFPLRSLIRGASLSFKPDNDAYRLPLHCDLKEERAVSADNPLIAPLYASDCGLKVTLVAAEAQSVRIGKLALAPRGVPPGGGEGAARFLCIHTLGLADSRNRPVVWRTEQEVNLHVRGAAPLRRPATLLIAPHGDSGAAVRLSLDSVVNEPIHAATLKSRFRPSGEGVLRVERYVAADNPRLPGVREEITSTVSTPAVEFRDGEQRFEHPKPGDAYVQLRPAEASLPRQVEPFRFAGPTMALPLLPVALFERPSEADRKARADLQNLLNKSFATHNYQMAETRHETFFVESPASSGARLKPKRVFQLDPAPPAGQPVRKPAELLLEKRLSDFKFGPITVRVTKEDGKELAYAILNEEGDFVTKAADFKFNLSFVSTEFGLAQQLPKGGAGLPRGVLKLSREISLEDILRREFGGDPERDDRINKFLENVDATVARQNGWTGLVMFNVPLRAAPTDRLLQDLTPKENFTLDYLAITPSKDDQKDQGFSINARVIWCPKKKEDPTVVCRAGESGDKFGNSPAESSESALRVNFIDVAWYESRLNFYHADLDFHFSSFFGLDLEKKQELRIIGSYDEEAKKIRFLGQLKNAIDLFEGGLNAGPVRQASVKGAEIVLAGGETAVSLDGAIELREFGPFKLRNAQNSSDARINFKNLRVVLPGNIADGKQHWCRIEYPALEFDLDVPPLRLGFLEAKLGRFAVDWKGEADFPWKELTGIREEGRPGQPPPELPTLSGPSLRFDLRLELMKLPELALASVDRLILDFTVAFDRGNRQTFSVKPKISVRAAGFENLRLDLMRFLTLQVDKANFKEVTVDGVASQWLELTGGRISILGKKIVENLHLEIFSADPDRRGFLGYLVVGADVPQPELLKIHWVLIGHNIEIDDNLAKDLIAVKATKGADESQKIGAEIALRAPGKEVNTKAPPVNGRSPFVPRDRLSKRGEWIFAASFTVMGVLEGKFLFQDNAYYGICLDGPLLKEWFGYDIGFSVLYIKGREPGQDTFVVSVRVPMVTMPEFTFMGGVVTVEIVMDGGFTLDIGFPWLAPAGSRQWERTFGAIVFPFQGSGGFYIRKRSAAVEDQRGICLSGGYALQFGLGASAGDSTFRVWATVGGYYILEGLVYFDLGQRKLMGGRLSGANGIVGRAAGELNYWIISLRIEVLISAESRATLEWGVMCDREMRDRRTKLILDFEHYAGVRASACLGSGWFKICKSIEVRVRLHFAHTIYLSS